MANHTNKCAIWPDYPANRRTVDQVTTLIDSDRTGGKYRIDRSREDFYFKDVSDTARARLTTWLVNRRLQGEEAPLVTEEVLASVSTKSSLPVHERVDRLLQFIAGQSETVGSRVSVGTETLAAYAWSESGEWKDISYFLDCLADMEWIRGSRVGHGELVGGLVTVAGCNRIASQSRWLTPDCARRL